MTLDDLVFDIKFHVEEELMKHILALGVIGVLLQHANDDCFGRDISAFDLGIIIENCLDDLSSAIEKAFENAKDDPRFVIQRAKDLIALSEKENKPPSQSDLDNIWVKLEALKQSFGSEFQDQINNLVPKLLEVGPKPVV